MKDLCAATAAPVTVLLAGLALAACAAPPTGMAGLADGRACYRTLARVDCHSAPLPGEAARRVGFFDWAALMTPAGG